MIILGNITKRIEVVLDTSAPTQLPFVASWVDISQSDFSLTSANSNDGATNNSTAVIMVPPPGANASRQLKYLSIYSSSIQIVTIRLADDSTSRILWKGTLSAGDSLLYLDGRGFYVLDNKGQMKVPFDEASADNLSALLDAVKETNELLLSLVTDGITTKVS